MKCLWILAAFVGIAAAIPSEFIKPDPYFGSKEYLDKEHDLLLVLKYVHQPHWNAELNAYGNHYSLKDDLSSYDHVEEVKKFVYLIERKGLLELKAVFSLYNPEHLEQTKMLFTVFYNAKTYETLSKVVAWARFNVNEKMFMYVLGTLIAHRKDVESLIMPPPYEVCPYQYVNVEAIKTAQRTKMQGFYGVEKVNGMYEQIIPVNYTGWYFHLNGEQKVSYLTEDVGLNAFYYNFNLDYPHWLEGKPYGLDKDRRGEMYIVMHHEIVARYYLERLSNDLGHIPEFNWREPIKAGYFPSLMYVSGKQFPTRHNNYNLYKEGNHKFIQEAEDRERRIRDIIDKGFVKYGGEKVSLSKPEDVDTLGNLLQGNPDSFGLHHNFHDHIVPSFLENYNTAIRDPLFYQFYQRLLSNYWKFMTHIEPYTEEELIFDGVKITDIHVDKIETFFEPFDIDITNAVDVDHDKEVVAPETLKEIKFKHDEYLVKARTMRLNHKPFDFKITVQSDKDQDASIRVWIGPKYDEFGTHIDFDENRKNFVMLDIYKETLKKGENILHRNSHKELMYYGAPQTTFYELYKHVMAAKTGEKEWPTDLLLARCQFPKNLMIPKGKKGGMTYQFFFSISPYVAPKTPFISTFNPMTSCGVGSGSRFFEDRALLFPIDREIDEKHFYVPNFAFEDVEIYFDPHTNEARNF